MSAEYKEYGWEAGEAHMQARIWQGVLRLVAQTQTKRLKDEETKSLRGQTNEECKTQNEKWLRGKRVLDVGCGNGFMCGQFLQLGCEVTGIDLSEQGVARARESFPAGRFEVMGVEELAVRSKELGVVGRNVGKSERGKVETWEAAGSRVRSKELRVASEEAGDRSSEDRGRMSEEEPFDIVISTEVVEHLYSPREWARACFAALRPGGRFVCRRRIMGM